MARVHRGAGEAARLNEFARQIRAAIIDSIYHAKAGHIGGPLSMADIVAALYFNVLDIRPEEPLWEDRDRLVLSKGHSSIGLYAAMALRGLFPVAELRGFDSFGSRLQGHPEMTKLPGVDMSTGSLGQGVSAAMGMALGAKLQGKGFHTFAIVGDGECQEGQVWECAMSAPRHGLNNFTVIVDANRLQQFGWLKSVAADGARIVYPPQDEGELAAKWEAFGWRVIEVDGHDMEALLDAFEAALDHGGDPRPACVIAYTVKGKGVSFMEGDYRWHTRLIPTDLYLKAMAELGEAEAARAAVAALEGGAA